MQRPNAGYSLRNMGESHRRPLNDWQRSTPGFGLTKNDLSFQQVGLIDLFLNHCQKILGNIGAEKTIGAFQLNRVSLCLNAAKRFNPKIEDIVTEFFM